MAAKFLVNEDNVWAQKTAADLSLGSSPAVPAWVKYHVTLTQFLAGQLNPSNFLFLPLISNALDVIVHDAVLRPTQSFAGVHADQIIVSVGRSAPGSEVVDSIVRGEFFGDGPGIENDRSYINYGTTPAGCGFGHTHLFPANTIGFVAPVSIRIYLQTTSPSGLGDYAGLTAGAVDIWLLQSVLP